MHVGLGVGTQLGLSLAKGLNVVSQFDDSDPVELARSVHRGLRSAVGTHGFFHGGLIYEAGKTPSEVLGPLAARVDIPATWRFVLVCPRHDIGLSGEAEQRAFARLPDVSREVSIALQKEATQYLLPAAAAADFTGFSDSVYRFGHQAGTIFAAVQGGPYNGPQLTTLVNLIRGWGVRGVGQSSWGPTLFAVCQDHSSAQDLVQKLSREPLAQEAQVHIAHPRNQGAVVIVEP
jgi:beta-RFAP synthase